MIRYEKLPHDIDQRIRLLTDLLTKDSNITFAYLFGGLLRDRRNPLSDVDLGIYVKSTKGLDYLALFKRVSEIISTDEIDLVVLNSAPISLSGRPRRLCRDSPFVLSLSKDERFCSGQAPESRVRGEYW